MGVLEQYVQTTIEADGSTGLADFSLPVADWTIANRGDGTISVTPIVFPASMQVGVEQYYFTQPSATLEQLIAESGATLVFTNETVFVENADNANLARLYSAALDRPPDARGLSSWETIFTNNIPFSAKAGGVYQALAQTNDGFGISIAGGFVNRQNFKPNTAIWTTLTSLPNSI